MFCACCVWQAADKNNVHPPSLFLFLVDPNAQRQNQRMDELNAICQYWGSAYIHWLQLDAVTFAVTRCDMLYRGVDCTCSSQRLSDSGGYKVNDTHKMNRIKLSKTNKQKILVRIHTISKGVDTLWLFVWLRNTWGGRSRVKHRESTYL